MIWYYCTKCGAKNESSAWKCTQCGEVLPRVEQSPQKTGVEISNYLVPAILLTLLCCPPCGIPAIISATQVKERSAAGNIQGAREASQKAKMWCWISFGIAIGGWLIYFFIVFLFLGVFSTMLEQ